MKKIFMGTLAIIMLVCATFTISACAPNPIEVDVSADLTAKSNALFSTYYNLPNTNNQSKQTISVSNAEYYVEIDSEIATADNYSVAIYNKKLSDADTDVSIGNNRFFSKKNYLVENGKFYLSVPVLSVEAKNGVVECYLNDQKYNITVFEANSTLQVSDVSVKGTTSTKLGTATKNFSNNVYTITHTKNYNNLYLQFTYTQGANANEVVANNYVFTRKIVNNSTTYGMDKTGAGGTTFYYPTGYLATDAPYTGTRSIDYTVSIVGIGTVRMIVNVSPYVPAT